MFSVCFCVTLLGGGLLWWMARDSSTALAYQNPPGYEPVDVVQHDAILALLDDVALDRDALIALNVSANQAMALVAAARSWQVANAAAVAEDQTAIDEARTAVREARLAIAMGPYDEADNAALASALQQLAAAEAAYVALLGGLQTALAADCSESQQAAWSAIENGLGSSMPIRMLALSDQQRLDLSGARRRYRLQYASAGTTAERSQAVAAWEQAQGQILTQDQQTIMASHNSYYADSSAAVAQALDTVLPIES
ncbi:MAG: hypothetical protein IID41_16415 [Planctomycetes bacterium]|nr:hypothetical protein [Planctomycetota bacterium]